MKIDRRKQQWLVRLSTFDTYLERPDKDARVRFHCFANSSFALVSEVTPLRSRLIICGQIAQGHREHEEVEGSDQQFIVIGGNVEQGDSSGTGTLVVASVL